MVASATVRSDDTENFTAVNLKIQVRKNFNPAIAGIDIFET